MRFASPLALYLTVILNSIDSSSQLDSPRNDSLNSVVPLSGIFDSPERHDVDGTLIWSATPHYSDPSVGTSHSPEPPLRLRSRSPRLAEPSFRTKSKSSANQRYVYIHGLEPEKINFVRLIPNSNQDRRLEIRKYTFPRDKALRLIGKRNVRMSIPGEEQTVLSTSDGDILAIIVGNYTHLRGIYKRIYGLEERVKINMISGAVAAMTPGEIEEAPLSKNRPISLNFDIILLNNFSS